MSVLVTTPRGAACVHFHNGFGWFLDSVFGGRELPERFFSQAIGPSAEGPDPGPLSAEQAVEFAAAIADLSDDELEMRLWVALNGREADPTMEPAIETVRQIADLASLGEGLVAR